VNPVETITPTSLVDEIAFRLETAILEGAFRPGTHLLQDELCARFGVSRTPVREALRKLQAQHLVVLVPNKGATVRFPTKKELHEVYVVRGELEGFACQLASATADAALIDALDEAQARIAEAQARLEQGEPTAGEAPAFNARITAANEAFHTAIFDAAGNARLAELCRSLQGYFPKDYVWRAALPAAEARRLNVEEHREIREALAANDGATARRAMGEHIMHGGGALISYLERHGFWD
jgi:DNA-binding GntR family transcriptional regulator